MDIDKVRQAKAGVQVVVIDGPFENFRGVIELPCNTEDIVRVKLSIFERAHSVDLKASQVKVL